MHRTLLALLSLALVACVVLANDDEKKKDDLTTDLDRPASPTRPAPKWVELVDLGKQDKRLAGYRAPAGLKVEIVAEAPAVINPVGLAFLDDGTPLVIEWTHDPDDKPKLVDLTFEFRDKTKRTVQAIAKRKKDVVKAMTVGKTGWEKPKVILEEEMPSTVLPFDGYLYVAGRGSVRRHKQSKADGPYDKVEVIARGFGGVAQHQVSGLTIGPDGWLYVSCGEGDNDVEGSDGSRATVLRTGAVFRCKPDGSNLHVFAHGFRNPYRDLAFDIRHQAFHLDNDGGGDKRFVGCRLLHLAEGSDFGWRTGYEGKGKADLARAAAFGEKPGRMPGMIKTGKGSPAGLLVYNDTQLPEEYRNLLLYPDASRKLIRAYGIDTKRSSFEVTEEFELLSAPKDDLFRPCQMVTGPDGAVYVVDWRTDSTGGGRLSGDGKNGRILRLSWAGTEFNPAIDLRPTDSWAKIAKLEDAKLIEALAAPDASARERARRELVKRGDKNRAALLKHYLDKDTPITAKVAAIGALQWMYDATVEKTFIQTLDKGDEELKRIATEALGLWAKKGEVLVQDALLKAVSDEDLAVRRAVVLAMGRVAGPGASDGLATALSFDEGKDHFLRDGIVRGLEMLGKDGMTALISLADSGVQKDTDRVVEVFGGMRSRAAFEALPTLLKHVHVSAEQRAELIRSVTNYQLEPPVSLEAVTTFVAAQKKETPAVKAALLTALQTPGVVGGKDSLAWSRGMLDDEDEVLAALAVAVEDTPAGAVRAGEALLKRDKPSRELRTRTLAALRKHEKDEAAARTLKKLEEKK